MGDKAGIWLRVSTRHQDEGNQVPDVMAWCDNRDYEIAETYQLRGKSAYKGQQAGALATMLEDMRRGKIQVLVVWKADRIERRGPRFIFDLVHQVHTAGGRIEFVTETYLNDLNAAGEMMLANMSIMAREESKTKSDRIRAGLATARANGAATNNAPWGYVVVGERRNKRFVVTEEGRTWVEKIFRAVAGGMTVTEAARQFSASTGRKFHAASIAAMIRNPAYKGLVVTGGTITHRPEALVDAELWRDANFAADNPARKVRGPAQPKAMLARALACGECGATMHRTAAEQGRQTRYYRCSASHGVMVPQALAEDAVSCAVVQVFGDRQLTRTEVIPGHNHEAEIIACKDELRLLDPDAADYDDQHAALRAELARLKALPATARQVIEIPTGVTFAEQWEGLSDRHSKGEFLRGAGVKVHLRRVDRGAVALSFDWGKLAPAAPLDVDGDDRVWTVYRAGGQVSETPVDWNSIMALAC